MNGIPPHGHSPGRSHSQHTDITKPEALVDLGPLLTGINPYGDPVLIGTVTSSLDEH